MNREKVMYGAGMAEWQKEMTDRIGRQVQSLRGKNTALWLSERTEKLGMKISRSALSELENGKRKSISLAEFLVLAAALDVSPIALLFPDYPDGEVEFLPGIKTSSFEASNWISGDQLLDNGLNDGEPQLYGFGFDVVKHSRERFNLLSKALENMLMGQMSPSEDISNFLEERKSELNHKIEKSGGTVNDGSR